MSANKLLFEIVRGLWAIDVSNIYAYAPIIDKILKGENVYQPKPVENSLLSFYNESGEKVNKNDFQNGFAQIDVIGELTLYGGPCAYGAEDYVALLDFANDNPNIQGSIMYVDGPGGSVASINPFREFKARKKKPVIGLVNTACSAHLWATLEVC